MIRKLLTVMVCLVVAEYTSAQDTLYWQPATKLQWTDFQGNANLASKFSAATSSGIVWSYAYKAGVFSFEVKTYFAKKKSWKKETVTGRMLQHEQGHFDITEIFARKLRQRVNAMSHERAYFEQNIAAVVAGILKEKDAFQRQYDTQTDYGTNLMAQQAWLRKIAGELAKQP